MCAVLTATLPTQPVHINLLSDSEADADGEDKPLAETARKRPVRAAAAAGQSLSQQLAGLKGVAHCCACLAHAANAYYVAAYSAVSSHGRHARG